jgi:LacI family transcriptional regulator
MPVTMPGTMPVTGGRLKGASQHMGVTRSQVAKLAGVSPAVVSYVVNNGPRPVAPRTRAAVEAAIEQLGYRPNALASALRAGSSRSVGLLIPTQKDPFYAALAEAVERRFSALGYLVLTGNTYYDRSREERYLRTFVDRKVDALIMSSGISLISSAEPGLDSLPVLVLDATPEDSPYLSIAARDADDAALAVEHLQRHGHTLVGCVAGPRNVTVEAERIRGWRRQQHTAGLPAGDELVAYADTSEIGGESAASVLLSPHGRPSVVHGRRPTALFVTSDIQATGAIYACYELGLRIPEDVAVVSLGGTRSAGYTIPPLTTMRQDVEYVAGLAAKELLGRVKDPSGAPHRSSLRGNLVVGRSCGCDHRPERHRDRMR